MRKLIEFYLTVDLTTLKKFNNFKKSSINRPIQNAPGNHTNQSACFRCGSKTHMANKCEITKGKTCHKCGKTGHFSSVCQSQPQVKGRLINYLFAESSSEDEFTFAISSLDNMNNNNNTLSESIYPIFINGQKVQVLIDSGSTVNVISQQLLNTMSPVPNLVP